DPAFFFIAQSLATTIINRNSLCAEVQSHKPLSNQDIGARLSLKPSSNLVIQKSSIDIELTASSCAKVSTNV
ncbi:hypothetical protein, partial [Sutterella wadsworthensis]|uniref:hypothetical protein n=1 Tax=Sutterella wadsworthensis TaxID=40545 RepID=UPI00307DB6AE